MREATKNFQNAFNTLTILVHLPALQELYRFTLSIKIGEMAAKWLNQISYRVTKIRTD